MPIAFATLGLANQPENPLSSLSIDLAIQAGLKPATCGLGNHCSVLLSYWTIGALGWTQTSDHKLRRQVLCSLSYERLFLDADVVHLDQHFTAFETIVIGVRNILSWMRLISRYLD
jgi:hypothetical protein